MSFARAKLYSNYSAVQALTRTNKEDALNIFVFSFSPTRALAGLKLFDGDKPKRLALRRNLTANTSLCARALKVS
jgi:hypothetical protein